TSSDSIDPGVVSKPVWRIAVFALLVPAPTSAAASTSAHEAPRRVSSRATAQPTTPAPTIATSNGPSGAGPSRSASPALMGGPPRVYSSHAWEGTTGERGVRRRRESELRPLGRRAAGDDPAHLPAFDPARRRDRVRAPARRAPDARARRDPRPHR